GRLEREHCVLRSVSPVCRRRAAAGCALRRAGSAAAQRRRGDYSRAVECQYATFDRRGIALRDEAISGAGQYCTWRTGRRRGSGSGAARTPHSGGGPGCAQPGAATSGSSSAGPVKRRIDATFCRTNLGVISAPLCELLREHLTRSTRRSPAVGGRRVGGPVHVSAAARSGGYAQVSAPPNPFSWFHICVVIT